MLELLDDLKKGKRRAIARAISMVENDQKAARLLVKKIFKNSGKSIIIGVTGPAGAGKSSLINKTTVELRALGAKPAVLAIDPTSHITGGAILGDRVRMTESTDSGTYIRSIASRGSSGAISHSLRNSIRILEYAGFDPIIVESVGAGQTEVEISNIVDVTVVVFNPHTGDSIQAIKAGLTEIGDIYVINKSDLAGATKLYDAVREHVGESGKKPLVLKTSAARSRGIGQLAGHLMELASARYKGKKRVDETRLRAELRDIVLNNISKQVDAMLDSDDMYTDYLERLKSGKMDPFEAGDRISKSILG